MSENKTSYLCGGILFFLLVEAKKSNASAREHAQGIKSDHKNPTVMKDWIYAITQAEAYGLEKDTSRYKDCLISGSSSVPLNEASVASGFDSDVKNKYSDTLGRMTEFVETHIDSSKMEWLVKAILDLINQDGSILETDEFYIIPTGEVATKAEMLAMSDFCLPAFLVGLMHYILLNRRETNERGQSTLEKISLPQNHKPRKYIGDLGTGIARALNVTTQFESAEPVVEIEEVPKKEKTRRELLEEEHFNAMANVLTMFAEKVGAVYDSTLEKAYGARVDEKIKNEKEQQEQPEAEVVDDEEPSGAAEGEKKITVIQQQTNVVQNGDNNLNITNNGTMNFNF